MEGKKKKRKFGGRDQVFIFLSGPYTGRQTPARIKYIPVVELPIGLTDRRFKSGERCSEKWVA